MKANKNTHRKRNVGISLLLLVAASIGVHSLTSSSSVGKQVAVDEKVVTTDGIQAPVTQVRTPAQQVASPYFTLALPVGYNPQPLSTAAGLLFAQTILKPGSMGSQIIQVAVKNLPSGGLSGDSSYTLRQSQPATYVLTAKSYQGETVELADSTQTATVTAFWAHGAYEATITVTDGVDNPADGTNQDIMHVLQGLLADWQWK
jgi:hypothetical protein